MKFFGFKTLSLIILFGCKGPGFQERDIATSPSAAMESDDSEATLAAQAASRTLDHRRRAEHTEKSPAAQTASRTLDHRRRANHTEESPAAQTASRTLDHRRRANYTEESSAVSILEKKPASVIKEQKKTRANIPTLSASLKTPPKIEPATDYFRQIALERALEEKNTEKEIPEEETSLISGELELMEDLVIQDRKVILDAARIKTFEYDLLIRAEKFISINSIIQNFPEGQKAERGVDGKNGGNILVQTDVAAGELQLILNGEQGGEVDTRRILLSEERESIRGQTGERGHKAVYKEVCRDSPLLGLLLFPGDKKCREVCITPPTQGKNGGDGLTGLPGWNGKNGGNSGSFHLKAFDLKDFRLADVQNNPGLGSPGGRGSQGGKPGKRGFNGTDKKKLCKVNVPRAKKGRKGAKGQKGQNGKDGEKGTFLLEPMQR